MADELLNPAFVEAVNANGAKQMIPREWLDHPVLSKGFRLPPSQDTTPSSRGASGSTSSAATPATGTTPPAGDTDTNEE